MRKRVWGTAVRAVVAFAFLALAAVARAEPLPDVPASDTVLPAFAAGGMFEETGPGWESDEPAFTPSLDLASASWSSASGARRQPQPTAPPARTRLRRQRPNTISLGVQGQYGAIRGNSRVAEGFDHGAGYAFRFRYMLSPSAALGFSFEHQRYGSVQPPASVPGEFADSHVVVTTVAAEGVFFIHREREFNPYFLGGFGFATPDVVYTESQAARANEGLFAVVGVGFERFIRPRFSLDVSARGFALVSNAEFTSMGQVSVGIHLYPGD